MKLAGLLVLGVATLGMIALFRSCATPEPFVSAQASSGTPQSAETHVDDGKDSQRDKLIRDLQLEGVFGDVDSCGGNSHSSSVIVKPRFYFLDFKDKQRFASVIFARCMVGTGSLSTLRLLDSKTNKRVGRFTDTGLDLD